MKKGCHVLLVGTSSFTDSARLILSPQADLRFILAQSVSIDLLINSRHPDVAVINCDNLRGEAANAICALLETYPKLPVIVVSSGSAGRVAKSVATAVIHPARMRNELAPVVASCREDLAVPLGVVDAKVRAEAHIAHLWHTDKDLQELARFWTTAGHTNILFLVDAPGGVCDRFRQMLKGTGLDPTKVTARITWPFYDDGRRIQFSFARCAAKS